MAVPLEVLQGEWVASRGEVIKVDGTSISINNKAMPGGLKLGGGPDGSHVVGFGIYKAALPEAAAAAGAGPGDILWLAGPQEIIWRRPARGEVSARSAFMDAHMLEKAATCGAESVGVTTEREAVRMLNELIERWREPGPLPFVRSDLICPAWTNRAQTGLSLDHVHYVATMIATQGFKSRRRGLRASDGAHDVPVVVRESADSEWGRKAKDRWRETVAAEKDFPPFLLEDKQEFFCSLGNGHFSQALNLFRKGSLGLWTGNPYVVGDDEALREALNDGVQSVVLSNKMPSSDQKFVSLMLNRSHGRRWDIDDDGTVRIASDEAAMDALGGQFEALSKVLDAEELSCLVRQKLGVDVDRSGSKIKPSANLAKRAAAAALLEAGRSRL